MGSSRSQPKVESQRARAQKKARFEQRTGTLAQEGPVRGSKSSETLKDRGIAASDRLHRNA